MQEQNKFKYIYNNEEVSREDFEKLAGDSFKWFDGDSIVSVPFSSFDSFSDGNFKSIGQINNYLEKVLADSDKILSEQLLRKPTQYVEGLFNILDLGQIPENIYKNPVKKININSKCSPQCFCNESCKKPQEKNTNSTRHKSQAGETHKETVEDLEGINRLPNTEKIKELSNKNSVEKTEKNKLYCIPTDATNVEVFHLSTKDNGDKTAFIGFKIKNGNFSFVEVPFTSPNSAEKSKIEDKDDVITNSNRGEKETMEYLQGLKYNNLKPSLDIVINRQFPKALQLIALATEYGHKKYIENDVNYLNYKSVKGGSQTYFDASARHSTDRNGLDESGLPHIIHAVWSSLAGLELWAEENDINVKEFTENYMKNLQD
jgi:hypothetical protein